MDVKYWGCKQGRQSCLLSDMLCIVVFAGNFESKLSSRLAS